MWTTFGRKRGENGLVRVYILDNDVLVLTHREDLLQQLRQHVNEYNAGGGPLFIHLRELKAYAELKRGFPSLLGHQEITVFTYRSDNLSDEQKERIIDFRNYDNHGRWYVLLDEAHKGDKQDSKRQHIYSILSRNGFLVNSVNTQDADLKLFFAQLERIARGEVGDDAFGRAKTALWQELSAQPEWLYEQARFTPDPALFQTLTLQDVLRHVFNTDSHGAIEVLTRPSNDKELAFKLKSAAAPFALIRIGNTAGWLKKVLAGYEIVQGFTDESFFERINQDDSEINLLMGSRSFYEGWDSNRPNVITFINIGREAQGATEPRFARY